MKYYFITYQATNKNGGISIWNEVIDTNPMLYIQRMTKIEELSERNIYYNFVVINTCIITREEYNTYKDSF